MKKSHSAPIKIINSVNSGLQQNIYPEKSSTLFMIILELIFVIILFFGFIYFFYYPKSVYKCQDHSIYKKQGKGWIKINGIC